MWKCSGALISHVTHNIFYIIHDYDDGDDYDADGDYDDDYDDDYEDEHKQQHAVKTMIMLWQANISNTLFDQKSPDHPMVWLV